MIYLDNFLLFFYHTILELDVRFGVIVKTILKKHDDIEMGQDYFSLEMGLPIPNTNKYCRLKCKV